MSALAPLPDPLTRGKDPDPARRCDLRPARAPCGAVQHRDGLRPSSVVIRSGSRRSSSGRWSKKTTRAPQVACALINRSLDVERRQLRTVETCRRGVARGAKVGSEPRAPALPPVLWPTGSPTSPFDDPYDYETSAPSCGAGVVPKHGRAAANDSVFGDGRVLTRDWGVGGDRFTALSGHGDGHEVLYRRIAHTRGRHEASVLETHGRLGLLELVRAHMSTSTVSPSFPRFWCFATRRLRPGFFALLPPIRHRSVLQPRLFTADDSPLLRATLVI